MKNVFFGDMDVLKPFGKPDVLIINHVLEHIVDLKGFLDSIKSMVNEDTLIYIAVPSVASISFQYENNACRYFQIAHIWHFSTNTLDSLMLQNGFIKIEGNEIIQAIYKYSGISSNISLLSEYYKNKLLIELCNIRYNNFKYQLLHNEISLEKSKIIEDNNDKINELNLEKSKIDEYCNKKLKLVKRQKRYIKFLIFIVVLLLILLLFK
jgi:2-polyprenyl-3-methyl-5-hydroxy-6-metoxy-1,4-benzoquinol methylase